MNSLITTIRADISGVSPELDDIIRARLMRPQQAAMRFAYNHLPDWEDKQIWNTARGMFPTLTGRNISDAIMTAKGIRNSQQERLPVLLESLKRQRQRLEEKLALCKENPGQVKNCSSKLASLSQKITEIENHITAGSVPPALFGGKKMWQQVQNQRSGARAEWRQARTCQFLSRGAKNNRGNPHCRLIPDAHGKLHLHLRLPDGVQMRGSRQSTRACWAELPLEYSSSFDGLLRQTAELGAAGKADYTVRLVRLSSGSLRVRITVSEPVTHEELGIFQRLPDWVQHACGIDLNLDHVAMVTTDCHGQFRQWNTITSPNLGELPRAKSTWQIGNLARDVIAWTKEQGAQAIILEDLNIRRTDQSHRSNRRIVPFSYRQLAQAITRRALREGLVVKRVNPAYSSWIGRLKYGGSYGVSIHVAAAYVIGRRGFGLEERLPKSVVSRFPALIRVIDGNLEQIKHQDISSKEKLQEWKKRLSNWKKYTLQEGKPWLLWATLLGISKFSSEARSIILG